MPIAHLALMSPVGAAKVDAARRVQAINDITQRMIVDLWVE